LAEPGIELMGSPFILNINIDIQALVLITESNEIFKFFIGN
jgi:hypothetical protein